VPDPKKVPSFINCLCSASHASTVAAGTRPARITAGAQVSATERKKLACPISVTASPRGRDDREPQARQQARQVESRDVAVKPAREHRVLGPAFGPGDESRDRGCIEFVDEAVGVGRGHFDLRI
jgi:hypothetical protein